MEVPGVSLMTSVVSLFKKAIVIAFPQVASIAVDTLVAQNQNAKMKHDYQCNAAMSLQKKLVSLDEQSAPKNPRDVAQKIIECVPANELVERLELAGPGFINIYLNKKWVCEKITQIMTKGIIPPPTTKLRVIVDYSSPNIAKDMHVGHLRSTIIGDSISRILEFCGHEVMRVNHVGDWGTQFGMLISHLKDIAPNIENEPPSIQDLTVFYKQAKAKFDNDEEFKKRAHEEVVKLQSGDASNHKLWKMLCDVSAGMFGRVYEMLNVDKRLEMVGESFYNPMLKDIVRLMDEKGLLQDSDGAKVCFPKGFETPLMVQKGDGGYGYDSTDMAAIRYRTQELKADWLIYVVDSGQSLHFKQVFAAAAEMGWTEGKRIDHVGFGVVQGEDKKKFKTRAGKSVRLVDLLDEARERALEITKKRVQEGVSGLSDEKEIEHSAAQLGYGGVKYFDLRQNRMSDYVFNFDRMLQPDGDTNVYLQYAHARIMSILRKSTEDIDTIVKSTEVKLDHVSEWDLACFILRFSDVLEQLPVDLLPNLVCKYVFDLSNKLNNFYRDCRVIGSDEQNSRLVIIAAAERVMRQSFDLLGIQALDRI